MREEVEEGTDDRELSDMPIWQDHEKRLTSVEIKQNDMQNDLREVRGEFQEIKDKIDEGNTEQIQKLDSFYERLADDFFETAKDKRRNRWKFAGTVFAALIGSGGIIYLVIEKIMGAM